MNVSSSETVLIDIDKTPMAGVASDASVVATYGQRFSSATAEVGVIRQDLGDAPNIYNTDKYEVYEDLPSHRSFKDIIAAASTGDNENLREYLQQTVLFVKQDPDEEHHRSELPATIKMLLNPQDI